MRAHTRRESSTGPLRIMCTGVLSSLRGLHHHGNSGGGRRDGDPLRLGPSALPALQERARAGGGVGRRFRTTLSRDRHGDSHGHCQGRYAAQDAVAYLEAKVTRMRRSRQAQTRRRYDGQCFAVKKCHEQLLSIVRGQGDRVAGRPCSQQERNADSVATIPSSRPTHVAAVQGLAKQVWLI